MEEWETGIGHCGKPACSIVTISGKSGTSAECRVVHAWMDCMELLRSRRRGACWLELEGNTISRNFTLDAEY